MNIREIIQKSYDKNLAEYLKKSTENFYSSNEELIKKVESMENLKFKYGQVVNAQIWTHDDTYTYRWVDYKGIITDVNTEEYSCNRYKVYINGLYDGYINGIKGCNETNITSLDENEEIPEDLKTYTESIFIGDDSAILTTVETFK